MLGLIVRGELKLIQRILPAAPAAHSPSHQRQQQRPDQGESARELERGERERPVVQDPNPGAGLKRVAVGLVVVCAVVA